MTDNNLFENTNTPTSKYDSWDIEALKKKAESADAHIATLEEENRTFRDRGQTEARIEEVLARLDQLKQQPLPNPPINPVNNTDQRHVPAAEVTKEDVLKLVSTTLEQKQKENQVKANVERIHKELKQAWGDNYKSILSTKAQEMSINQDFLISMAETHPDAFLKLVLDKSKLANPNAHVPPSSNAVHVPNVGTMTGETYKDFKKAMEANPNLRTDPTFNRRMHEAAERLGQSFYS
jgi:hypothetical protein